MPLRCVEEQTLLRWLPLEGGIPGHDRLTPALDGNCWCQRSRLAIALGGPSCAKGCYAIVTIPARRYEAGSLRSPGCGGGPGETPSAVRRGSPVRRREAQRRRGTGNDAG